MADKRTVVFAVIVGLGIAFAGVRAAEETGKAPSMEEMQKKMAEYGTPGEAHARLKSLEGKWDATTRMWMKPGDKAEESTGTSDFSWVLDGRFLKQEFHGQWMNKPFEGLGFLGYNNMTKQYHSVWMDSMATGTFEANGRYDAKAKTIKDHGTFACPMTGDAHTWFRAEWKLPEGDTSTYAMYMKDPATGKEFKSMEIVYTRSK